MALKRRDGGRKGKNKMKKRIIVVGAGAAGMMAAIASAREGASVTVLEAMERPGKKLLLTGNGRCNLTNTDPALPESYYGSGSKMAEKIIRRFDAGETRAFFMELGLLTQEKNGYVYPYTAQSGSVLQVLLAELRRQQVKLKFSEKIQGLSFDGENWLVKTDTWEYPADAVILACGSKAVPSTGSDGSGYLLAEAAGHTVISPAPALVPVTCKGDFFHILAGVRCRAEVSLWERRGERRVFIRKEKGELQWTKYGVSGIVVFQLSRFITAGICGRSCELRINLLPDFDAGSLLDRLTDRARELPGEKVSVLLAGFLPDKLVLHILKQSGVSPKTPCSLLEGGQLKKLLDVATDLPLAVTGTRSFDVCQVCSGGVDCREVSADTLESLKRKGLYFAGEILDVDGPCGGYNLQWAWSSGYTAGRSAAGAFQTLF